MTRTTITIPMVPGDVYTTFRYPAGETQVRLTDAGVTLLADATHVRVIARIRSAADVMELVQLLSAIESTSAFGPAVELVLPYLPYSRADRRFTAGDCFGVEAFGNVLAALGVSGVRTLDVHSNVAFLKIPSLVNIRPDRLIRRAIEMFATTCGTPDLNILFPDEGARTRYANLMPGMHTTLFGNNHHPIRCHPFHATKTRDAVTGALSGFELPVAFPHTQPTFIVDDLCDGGGTFLGLAEKLSTRVYKGLYVTHGIFSKGTNVLTQKFFRVYTTNSFHGDQILREVAGSYVEDPNPYVHVLDAMPLLLGKDVSTE